MGKWSPDLPFSKWMSCYQEIEVVSHSASHYYIKDTGNRPTGATGDVLSSIVYTDTIKESVAQMGK